ncbi:hypothetical protein PILCRDRAFT_307504 [Piloderma croceum F 1598]|uniref:Uncharacterized protein n=1 Tax=Piloderma croceum (strain F 1598) TaxID=765440 RepID=A0A0C3FQV4_PILCF|nr:hypothetical protein PILCRDRAFT_307504 [Piloderma croceum F 1598]
MHTSRFSPSGPRMAAVSRALDPIMVPDCILSCLCPAIAPKIRVLQYSYFKQLALSSQSWKRTSFDR